MQRRNQQSDEYLYSRMNIFASLLLRLMRYANWKGSICELITPMLCCLTILSIAFIAKEMRATCLKSLSTLVVLFLRDEDDF